MSGIKKFFSTGLLALLTTAYLTSSCSREDFSGSIIESKKQAFSDNFRAAYGNINPNQDWGFGSAQTSTRAFTRSIEGAMPSKPEFRDTNPITQPTMPTAYYNTIAAVKAAGVKYGSESFNSSETIYIDEALMSSNPDFSVNDKDNMVVYVDGKVTYKGGFSANGTTICVTEKSTLKLQSWNYKLTIYLAPGATLDFTTVDTQYMELSRNGGDSGGIYMSSGSTVKSVKLRIFNGYEILNNGGTISCTTLEVDQNAILWNNGTVKVSGELKGLNVNPNIYNALGCKITAGSINMGNNENLIYNDGTIISNGDIVLTNSKSEIVNNGTLRTKNGGNLDLSAGGKMHNTSITKIDGETKLTNTNSVWMNDGKFTSGTFSIHNARHVYNNCKLTVKGNFLIKEGDFIMEGGDPVGASVICDSLTWELNPDMWLGDRALVKVNKVLMAKGFNSGYGIRGIGDEYAVIQAESVQKDEDNQYSIAYFGKLYVDAKSHFEQGYINVEGEQQPYYGIEGDVKFSFSDNVYHTHVAEPSPIVIPSIYDCSPGYGDDKNNVIVLKQCGRVFCEDLGNVTNRDMDYNDVVFDAWIYVRRSYDSDGNVISEKHYRTFIQLLAAGGTLPIDVADKGEVHKKFGIDGDYKMINTYIPVYSPVQEDLCVNMPLPAEYEITNELDEYYARPVEGETNGICLKNIPIFVKIEYEVTELDSDKGDAPHKFCCPLGTKWAGERITIDQAYPTFDDWVQNLAEPWETYEENNLYTFDSSITYNPATAHGDTMVDDGYGLDESYGDGDGDGDDDGDDEEDDDDDEDEGDDDDTLDFGYVPGVAITVVTTPLTDGEQMDLTASTLEDVNAATIYVCGTGDGDVQVNGVTATTISTSNAPVFAFTRSGETPVVKRCILAPTKMNGSSLTITGSDFTVYKVKYDVSQPSVNQPNGNRLYGGDNLSMLLDWNKGSDYQCFINGSDLSTIAEGTIIRVAGVGYEAGTDSWQLELDITTDPWTKIPWNRLDPEHPNHTYWTESNTAGAVTVSWTLSAEEAEAIKTRQLVVQGLNFILKYVTVDNSNVTTGDSGSTNATATIDLVTSSNTITVSNNATQIVSDQTTARGYANRIVAGTTKLVGKVRINADHNDNTTSWAYSMGAGNSGNDLIESVNSGNTSGWQQNDVKDIDLLLTSELKQKIVDAVSNDYYWPGGMFTFQGNNTTLFELKLINCLPAE